MKQHDKIVVLHDGVLKTAEVLSSEVDLVILRLQNGFIFEVSKKVIVTRTDKDTLKLLEKLID
jgi:hypothetical protein